jgi:hypothetical protein
LITLIIFGEAKKLLYSVHIDRRAGITQWYSAGLGTV